MTASRAAAPSRSSAPDRRDLLRTALVLDAAVTGLNGAAYLGGAPYLADLLGRDAVLLRGIGGFLLAYGIGVGVLGTRQRIPRLAARLVVGVNAAWAVGSTAAALLGWGTPTAVGTVWIVLQALVVGGFAGLQWAGLRAAGAPDRSRSGEEEQSDG